MWKYEWEKKQKGSEQDEMYKWRSDDGVNRSSKCFYCVWLYAVLWCIKFTDYKEIGKST
jgi:hypothetical protein